MVSQGIRLIPRFVDCDPSLPPRLRGLKRGTYADIDARPIGLASPPPPQPPDGEKESAPTVLEPGEHTTTTGRRKNIANSLKLYEFEAAGTLWHVEIYLQ